MKYFTGETQGEVEFIDKLLEFLKTNNTEIRKNKSGNETYFVNNDESVFLNSMIIANILQNCV